MGWISWHPVLIAASIERAIVPGLSAALLSVAHGIAPGAERAQIASHQGEVWCLAAWDDVIHPCMR